MRSSLSFLIVYFDFHSSAETWSTTSVCISAGRAASEQFVVPCIETALSDDVEQVICEALCCLKALVSLSLLTRTSLLGTDTAEPSPLLDDLTRPSRKKQGVIKKCGPLLLHPSRIVRTHAASLILLGWQILGNIDVEVVFCRLLKPYLQFKPTFESISHLCACAKVPLKQKCESSMDMNALNSSMPQNDSMEISSKLSHNLSVPSQMSAVRDTKRNIEWYDALLRAASENPSFSVPLYSLGFASIQEGTTLLEHIS